MSYPARLLEPGEEVVVDTRAHGWCLALPVTVGVAALAGAVATATVHVARGERLIDGAAGTALLLVLCWLVARWARWSATSMVVTTERVVWRRGVVVRSQTDIPLGMVRDVRVRQSLGQRALRAGDLVVDSGAAEEVFRWVPAPGWLRRQLWRQVDLSRRAGAAAPVAEELGRLDDLRRRGVLDPVEFESEKARLLRR